MMKIPLVDLDAQYRTIQGEIDDAISSVLVSQSFIGGHHVQEFRESFAKLVNSKFCVPCANGTDAIYIALRALDIGEGDEVITVANSWISTSETISQTGATPVFVDVDEYFHIDSRLIEAKITDKTTAIVPVHLYGQPADMDSVMELASKYDLRVIEDCAQAHLAKFDDQTVGTFGDAGTFSFYPGKNLGAYGDAGALITQRSDIADYAWKFANHGAEVKHHHEMEGINSRLDGLQAAVLQAKLPHLEKWTERRKFIAGQYDDLLSGIPEIVLPLRREGCTHVFHLYVVRCQQRDALASFLKAEGIGCAIHYPTPLPMLPAYEYLGHEPGEFPAAESAAAEILSLPIYPELTTESVERVVSCIKRFYS